jgi:hypothetical protein
MSDKELTELHSQGREALRPGAWEVLDEELRRRARVRRTSPSAVDEDRYPAIRITVTLLKVEAAVVLVVGVVAAVFAAKNIEFLTAILFLVAGLLLAVSYWAGAELLVLLMDIEANTRVLRERE